MNQHEHTEWFCQIHDEIKQALGESFDKTMVICITFIEELIKIHNVTAFEAAALATEIVTKDLTSIQFKKMAARIYITAYVEMVIAKLNTNSIKE